MTQRYAEIQSSTENKAVSSAALFANDLNIRRRKWVRGVAGAVAATFLVLLVVVEPDNSAGLYGLVAARHTLHSMFRGGVSSCTRNDCAPVLPWLIAPSEGRLQRCLSEGSFHEDENIAAAYVATAAQRLARCVFHNRIHFDGMDMRAPTADIPGVQIGRRLAYDRESRKFFVSAGVVDLGEMFLDGYLAEKVPYYAFLDGRFSATERQRWHEALDALEYNGPRIECGMTVQVGMLAFTHDGGFLFNYWHSIATILEPLFTILYDAEALFVSDPSQFALFATLPQVEQHPPLIGTPWEEYMKHGNILRKIGTGRYSFAALFGGVGEGEILKRSHVVFTDDNDPSEPGFICIDRAYIRTATYDWSNPSQHLSYHGGDARTMHWARRQLLMKRWGIDDVRLPPVSESKQMIVTYITRRNYVRHISNEDELLDRFTKYMTALQVTVKWHIVDANNVTEIEVTRLISRSHVLMMPHGAASSHSVFLPPGSLFFVMHSNGFVHVLGEGSLWYGLVRCESDIGEGVYHIPPYIFMNSALEAARWFLPNASEPAEELRQSS